MHTSNAKMTVSRAAGPADGTQAASVVPRWEFRWMDRASRVDPAWIDRWMAAPVEFSAETYFVSFRTPHNAKLRRGALDLKRLDRISKDGIERWTPVLKTPFPLDPPVFGEICGAWGAPVPDSGRVPTTIDELRRYVDTQPDLRRVELVKRRRRIEQMRCPGELVEITVADQHWMSLAFEDEDLELVRAVLAQLGLDPRQNLNYPAALKRLFLRSRSPVHAGEGVL